MKTLSSFIKKNKKFVAILIKNVFFIVLFLYFIDCLKIIDFDIFVDSTFLLFVVSTVFSSLLVYKHKKTTLWKLITLIFPVLLIVKILININLQIDINSTEHFSLQNLNQYVDFSFLYIIIFSLFIKKPSPNYFEIKKNTIKKNYQNITSIVKIKLKNIKIQSLIRFLILMLILFIGSVLRLYNLGKYDMRDDELFVVDSAYNFLNEGDFYKWDWVLNTSGKNTSCLEDDEYCNYTRAWPYTLTIACSYKLLGVNEFTTRLPGALFGIMGILTIYLISKIFIPDRNFSLLSSFLFAINPQMIIWSRFPRMYSLLIPLFMLTTYFFYKAIIGKNMLKTKNKLLTKLFKIFNFNYIYMFWGGILFLLCLELHVVSLILIPFLIFFLFIQFITQKEKKYLYALILVSFFVFIGFLIFPILLEKIIYGVIDLGEVDHRIEYKEYLLGYPFSAFFSISLAIGSIVSLIKNPNSKLTSKIIFLGILTLGSLLMYTRFIKTGLFIDSRYISFLIPFSFIVSCLSLYLITGLFKKKIFSFLMIMLFSISAIFSSINPLNNYFNYSLYPSLEETYSTVKDNYQKGELIISNSLRYYYIKEINTTDIYKMAWRQEYTFSEFYKAISSYDSGWIIWEVDKVERHIKPEIYNFVEERFIKLHGSGVDETNVDIYYYKKNMLEN